MGPWQPGLIPCPQPGAGQLGATGKSQPWASGTSIGMTTSLGQAKLGHGTLGEGSGPWLGKVIVVTRQGLTQAGIKYRSLSLNISPKEEGWNPPEVSEQGYLWEAPSF